MTKFVKKQVMKDAELVAEGSVSKAVWHFFVSGVTGKGGPSEPLMDFLKKMEYRL